VTQSLDQSDVEEHQQALGVTQSLDQLDVEERQQALGAA